jgi:hypothetical protein
LRVAVGLAAAYMAVVAVPGAARPAGRSGNGLETGRRVLIGVLSVALVANLARRRGGSVGSRRRM